MNVLRCFGWFLLLVVTFLVGAVIFFWANRFWFPVSAQTKKSSVNLESMALGEYHWSNYRTLSQKTKKFFQRSWSGLNPELNTDYTDQSIFNQDAINHQIDEIKRIFQAEENFKRVNLKKFIKDYSKKCFQEINEKIKTKNDLLTKALNLELQKKTREITISLEGNRVELESEYQLVLSNLQLQKSIASLGESQGDLIDEQEIQAQIDVIHGEIEEKLKASQRTLTDEFENHQKLRKEQIDSELNNYRIRLESEYQNDLARFQQALETEFSEWYSKREKELALAIRLRQEQCENN